MTTLAITNPLLSRAPDFSQVSEYGRLNYENFFEYTSAENRNRYAKGASLQELAELASSARNVINFVRLSVSSDSTIQDQWQLNQLSEIKNRLSNAIILKRDYYDSHPFGIITKFVLMLFGQWNGGDTQAIVDAEDFLLFWDSRKPVMKVSNTENSSFGKYLERQDFQTQHLDTSRFFNYNPRRLIEMSMGDKFNYNTMQRA